MRSTVRAAVTALLAAGDEPAVILGGALLRPSRGKLGLARLRSRGRGLRTVPRLPLALALGEWLVDDVDPGRPRSLVGVGAQDAAACARCGAALVRDQDVRLLVAGDGSACRSEKAPGHLDPRADGRCRRRASAR